MKNREKYRDEIAEALKDDNQANGKLCCFVQNNIIPRFVCEEDMEGSACGGVYCQACAKMFAFWLDEEYVEPPKPEVDWSKVPVDTLVRVQYDKSNKWILRYFKGYEHGAVAPYVTWVSGTTSATSGGLEEHWKYCELVEEEDDGSN